MLVSRRTLRKGQFFIALDDDAFDDLKGSCREYTLPRSEESSHVRGWIRGNTKIGPVLDVKVCYHQGRYGVEITIESSFRDRTVSWVRIVTRINKYVTETSEEMLVAIVENRGTGKPCRERLNHDRHRLERCLLYLFLIVNENGWILNQENSAKVVFEVSKFMIRLLRQR